MDFWPKPAKYALKLGNLGHFGPDIASLAHGFFGSIKIAIFGQKTDVFAPIGLRVNFWSFWPIGSMCVTTINAKIMFPFYHDFFHVKPQNDKFGQIMALAAH